jgi:hypothetical protein
MSVLINKLLLNIMILVYSLAGLVNFCHSATNLALHKPYWVSPLPSYPLTAPSSDSTSLTDGKYTFGHFWTAKSTVGWWPVRDVEILIDLEKVGNIGKITFNTVRGDYANVQYPKHIYAFVGLDREHLMFAGDMADDPENNPGLYRVKRFVLDVAGIKGRYLLLKITPADSNSVFCDEIEVLEGKDVKGKTGNLTVKKARKMADRLKWLDPYRDYLEKADTDNVSTLNHPDLAERIRKIRTELAGLGRAEDVEAVEAEILTLRAELLRKRLPGKELLVESAKPWARMPLLPPSSVVTPLGVSLLLPQGGYGHDALVVTNLSREMRLVTASLSGMAGGGPEIYLYQVPFVKSLATEFVADSLVPVEEGFTLRPGESRMVFVSARGKSWGEWKTSIDVASGGSLVSIPVICRVFPVALPDSQTLSSVNWGI